MGMSAVLPILMPAETASVDRPGSPPVLWIAITSLAAKHSKTSAVTASAVTPAATHAFKIAQAPGTAQPPEMGAGNAIPIRTTTIPPASKTALMFGAVAPVPMNVAFAIRTQRTIIQRVNKIVPALLMEIATPTAAGFAMTTL
jgi:hypothetical protein